MTFTWIRTVLALSLAVVPLHVHGATLSFESLRSTVSAGDTVVVRAYLDSGSDALNALDGDLVLRASTAAFTMKEVSLSGSALSVWPTNPVVSPDGKEVTFTGGTPVGIPAQQALVLSLVLSVTSPGTLVVSTASAVGYKDDGKGTQVAVTSKPLTLSVLTAKAGTPLRDQWAEIVGTDTTPPEAFEITLGHDPSVFDGKQFIAFQTTDAQSGIDRYEVQEGTAAPVVSDVTYVLKNQSTAETVTVFAYDKAGNIQRATLTTAGTPGMRTTAWGIGSVFLLLMLILWIVRSRNKKHA